jgi:hypothetical protein
MSIRTTDNKAKSLVLARRCESLKTSEKTKLVFHRYGDRYFLAQIWMAGSNSGHEIPKEPSGNRSGAGLHRPGSRAGCGVALGFASSRNIRARVPPALCLKPRPQGIPLGLKLGPVRRSVFKRRRGGFKFLVTVGHIIFDAKTKQQLSIVHGSHKVGCRLNPASEKVIARNRANSQHSTGPKDTRQASMQRATVFAGQG